MIVSSPENLWDAQCGSPRLDDTDRRLLRTLQADGRISNADLAERCDLSPSACSDRVRRLREAATSPATPPARSGEGRARRADLRGGGAGPHHAEIFETFAAAARRAPDVLECHMVAGGFDYLIKARVRDLAAYRKFLARCWCGSPASARRAPSGAGRGEVHDATAGLEQPNARSPAFRPGPQLHRTLGDRDQKLMSIVERRFSGSFTPSPVATAGAVSPFQSTDSAVWATPRPTRASATALARRSDRRTL